MCVGNNFAAGLNQKSWRDASSKQQNIRRKVKFEKSKKGSTPNSSALGREGDTIFFNHPRVSSNLPAIAARISYSTKTVKKDKYEMKWAVYPKVDFFESSHLKAEIF